MFRNIFEKFARFYYKDISFCSIEKNMNQQNLCKGCIQQNRCQEAYERLGRSQEPSVLNAVLIAFLMPMVVFIVSLAVFELVLTMFGIHSVLKTLISTLGSLTVVVLSIFAVRVGPILLKSKGKSEKTI
jgi:hypothetical protein